MANINRIVAGPHRLRLRLLALVLGTAIPLANWAGSNVWTSLGLQGNIITALAIDPSTPTTLYAGTGYSGIFKSDDQGNSWTAINNGISGMRVGVLCIDPSNPNTVYALIDGVLFRTTNAGTSWIPWESGLAGRPIMTLTIDPSTPTTLYVGVYRSGVFKSTDGGATWVQEDTQVVGRLNFSALAVAPSDPATLYATGSCGGVMQSTNGGMTWSERNDGLQSGPAPCVGALAIDPSASNTIYVGNGGLGVFKSTDGGMSWIAANSGFSDYALVSSIAIDPSVPTTIYAAPNGGLLDGVFRSADGGQTWAMMNAGLTWSSVQVLAIDPSDSSVLYAGTNGGGIFSYVVGPTITSIAKNSTPFRLVLKGSNFHPGATATIGTAEWTKVAVKSSGKLVIKGGSSLADLLHKGDAVNIVIINPDGGTSAPYVFTR